MRLAFLVEWLQAEQQLGGPLDDPLLRKRFIFLPLRLDDHIERCAVCKLGADQDAARRLVVHDGEAAGQEVGMLYGQHLLGFRRLGRGRHSSDDTQNLVAVYAQILVGLALRAERLDDLNFIWFDPGLVIGLRFLLDDGRRLLVLEVSAAILSHQLFLRCRLLRLAICG